MTEELFREDAYLKTCEAVVLEAEPGGLELDRTVFYPTGGGQPGDTGVLRMAGGMTLRIVDTIRTPEGTILHVPEAGADLPSPGTDVDAAIDWDRRHRHMRMHSCLHLLCAAVDGAVTGGSVGAEKSRLDFDLPDAPDKEALTARLNEMIDRDAPLAERWISDADLEAQPELVRTMSVKPPTGSGKVRLMEVADLDLQPCGGTHVRSTGEIGPVRVSKIEKKGKMNRRISVVFAED